MVSVLRFSILLVRSLLGLFDFLLFLFDQESLHRIIVVVISHEYRQFPFLWEHRSLDFFLAALLI